MQAGTCSSSPAPGPATTDVVAQRVLHLLLPIADLQATLVQQGVLL
jgi:hypothetical protein